MFLFHSFVFLMSGMLLDSAVQAKAIYSLSQYYLDMAFDYLEKISVSELVKIKENIEKSQGYLRFDTPTGGSVAHPLSRMSEETKQQLLNKINSLISSSSVSSSSNSPLSYIGRLEKALGPLKSDIVYQFILLSGTIWVILGVITLGGSLKDKNSPNLQSGLWQIVGGSMVLAAAKLFNEVYDHPKLLTEILSNASYFIGFGGALWLIWGVVVLAGALKDKTGPALQSGIWQIVSGGVIIYASNMLASISTTLTKTY